jgi:DNA-binding transcriptional MerR regulator
MSIKQIKQFVDLAKEGKREERIEMLRAHKQSVEREIDVMKKHLKKVEQKIQCIREECAEADEKWRARG